MAGGETERRVLIDPYLDWAAAEGVPVIEDYGVVPDFREPDLIRFGVTPINTRFVDVWDAVDRLRRAAADRTYERFSLQRSRVT